MLDIIDDLNKNGLPQNSILVSLDVVNMFPSIDNKSGIESVKQVLNLRHDCNPPTSCLVEALQICLESNNSWFNNKHYLQIDGTAQGPHMSCSYADIVMAKYDKEAMDYYSPPEIWKRFRDDVFMVWTQSEDELTTFETYMNSIDSTGKIKFELVKGSGLDFLDLNLRFNSDTCRIEVDVYAKPTNSFTYVIPTTCYPKNNIDNIPYGIFLRLRRICDTDTKYNVRAEEYSNYLIARDYNPTIVNKHMNSAKQLSRTVARQPKHKSTSSITKHAFITTYNPKLPDIRKIMHNHMDILHSDPAMQVIFPKGTIKPIFRRGKNLKEILSPSRFPSTQKQNECSINVCGSCNICKNYYNTSPVFKCKVTGITYKVKGNITCNSRYVVYLITCKSCGDQYVGSTDDFKTRARGHKSDNKTNKWERCGAAKHFNVNCKHPQQGANGYFSIQIIESIPPDQCSDDLLWEQEKYWQAQLFTITRGMNCLNDWYCKKRKGHRNMKHK